MAKGAASSQEEITLMTVKHWNTGAAAARFRIQAASVKLKKNLAGADSPKKTQSALANSGRKHQVTSRKRQAASVKHQAGWARP